MRYNNNCILEVDQKLFEPRNRIEVQVVCRLIQKQNIRITKQCLCEKYLDLQIAIEFAHHLIMDICIYTKSVQKCCSIALRIPAIHLSKFCLEFGCTDTVFIREVFFGINCVLFLHNIIQSLISHDNCVEYHILVIFEVILLQDRQTLAIVHDNFAIRRFEFSGKNLQERRFTGTICTDQTITVSLCKLYIYIFKQSPLSKPQGYIICTNHFFFLSLLLIQN